MEVVHRSKFEANLGKIVESCTLAIVWCPVFVIY